MLFSLRHGLIKSSVLCCREPSACSARTPPLSPPPRPVHTLHTHAHAHPGQTDDDDEETSDDRKGGLDVLSVDKGFSLDVEADKGAWGEFLDVEKEAEAEFRCVGGQRRPPGGWMGEWIGGLNLCKGRVAGCTR